MGDKRRGWKWHVGQAIGYAAVRWIMSWIRVFSFQAAPSIGSALGALLYVVLRGRVRTAVSNLIEARVASDPAAARDIARRMFGHLGRFAVEVGLLEKLSRGVSWRKWIRVVGTEHVRAALAEGKGAILSIGHLGNWEFSSLGFCRELQTLHSVYRPLDYPPLDRLVLRIRTSAGMRMIDNTQAIPRIARLLRRNELVALLTDQDARQDGVFVEFFGRPASTLPTPALLAVRLGTAIVPTNVYREGLRHVIEFDPPIFARQYRDAPDAVRSITQEVQRRLEGFIRKRPEQWFWLHRRWKTRPT
jgi:KDO2-lipid IV(A) lauroyltransferase